MTNKDENWLNEMNLRGEPCVRMPIWVLNTLAYFFARMNDELRECIGVYAGGVAHDSLMLVESWVRDEIRRLREDSNVKSPPQETESHDS